MNDSLTSQTLKGLKWSYLSTIVNSVLQIGFTVVMARLLGPPAFGLVAMARVVLRFASYFADMGVGRALVQKKEISSEDIRASFTSAFFLGIVFFGITWFAAPLAVYVFNSPEVISVLRLMALSLVLTGLSMTAMSLLRRKMEFRVLAIIDTSSYIIGYGGVGITLAYVGFGVWSLVIAALSQGGISVVLSYLFSRHSLSPIYRWKPYRSLYSFGTRVSMISFLEFITSNLDTLAIGHFIGAAALGIYNRAFMLVNLPMEYFSTSFSKVLFPSFSRIQTEIPRLKKAYLSSIMIAAAFLVPTCSGIAVASREIVLLVLGDKWTQAIPVLQILALATPFSLLSHFSGVVCEATATLNVKIVLQASEFVILGTLFYALAGWGLIGFAFAVLFGEAARYVGYHFIVKRLFGINRMETVSAYVPALAIGLIVGTVLYVVASLLREQNLPVVLLFVLEALVGLVLLVSSLIFSPRHLIREEILTRLLGADIELKNHKFTGKIVSCFRKIVLSSS
jgi:O-antigen/teichoic acid export membrane protein